MRFGLVISIFVTGACGGYLSAQDFRATITGQVSDASGSAIVGAQILEVGSLVERMVVSASADVVQSADASGGLNFDSLQTSEYPLNGRQVYMLMDLTPGVLFIQEQFVRLFRNARLGHFRSLCDERRAAGGK